MRSGVLRARDESGGARDVVSTFLEVYSPLIYMFLGSALAVGLYEFFFLDQYLREYRDDEHE